MSQLPPNFWTIPKYANTTLSSKDLKAVLLANDGWIFACGDKWDIRSKGIGAGVYRVWLEMSE